VRLRQGDRAEADALRDCYVRMQQSPDAAAALQRKMNALTGKVGP
jgi:hypothetical protein